MHMSGMKKRTRHGRPSRRKCWKYNITRFFNGGRPKWLLQFREDYLGPLSVTPEMVANKIKAMKDNKSLGVDGIPPKLLMETVEQISIPLARVLYYKK